MDAEPKHDPASAAVLVLTKAPHAGQVKTRLIPALGEQGAAELYTRLLRRQIHWLSRQTPYAIQLWVTPEEDHPLLRELAETYGLERHRQRGCDLGERMHHAARSALQSYQRVILLGVDCPALTAAHLRQAFVWLERHDGVLGPAEDGGYVLLGLKKAADPLFQGHNWGEADVAATTRAAFRELHWSWRELPLLWDLDRPEDLPLLRQLGISLPA